MQQSHLRKGSVVVVVVGRCDIGEVQWRKGRWQGAVGRRCCSGDLVMRRVGRGQWVKWADEAQAEDRRRRNADVDSLIQQMATDPKVAEKLRIYRLVEQQFEEIESQVRQEVTRDIRESCQAKHNGKAKEKKSEAYNVAGEFAV